MCKWFHGAYLANVFTEGLKVALYGKVEFDPFAGQVTMMHPEYEILSGDDDDAEATLHTGRIVPIYEGVSKLTTRSLRVFIHRVLGGVQPMEDHLPAFLIARLKLPDLWTAVREMHFPPAGSDLRLLNAFRHRRSSGSSWKSSFGWSAAWL